VIKMGKSLIQQKRGKGSPTYRAPSHRYKGSVKFNKNLNYYGKEKIIDIERCPGHSAPVIKIRNEQGKENILIAPEGIKVGDNIEYGLNIDLNPGNIMPLKNIPEGSLIYNIESQPGDGGKFVRSSGSFATILSRYKEKVMVLLPSKKEKVFNPECRAVIGVVAGGGLKEKPFLKAGTKYHMMRARNKLYPKVSGVSMNAISHPFGGTSSHTKGRPTQSSRNAPPGRKVGKIAPRRTGRKNI
jgi:large subunit ribosomal protein L2